MRESVEMRLRTLARRAGLGGAPPAVVAAALALACVAVAVAVWRWWPSAGDAGGLVARAAAPAAAGARHSGGANAAKSAGAGTHVVSALTEAGSAATLCVDVVGAVRHPGCYVLVEGTRVGTAIEVAGGAAVDAATEAVNLAAKLQDGEQVVIPTREQVAKGIAPGAGAGAGGAGGGGAAGGAGASAAKVNLNTADATQLDALPGVGPSTAAKIVADRQTNGPYKTADDLGRVPGIGPKKLDQLKALVVVR